MKHFCLSVLFILAPVALVGAGEKSVNLVKTPGQGIQPQVAVDAKGTVHLLYFTGTPAGGNLNYARREAGQQRFSAPIKVNSVEGSAIAVGTIRGGQIALGKNGRVHVAWNGSGKAEKNPLGGMPMLYARMSDDGKSFEPQRNLMTRSYVLDGGGTLAADAQGNVFVAWHGLGKDSPKGEDNRKVWLAASNNEGKSFAAEKSIDASTGACGCCGMNGFADSKGRVYFLYRAATRKENRGMYALFSDSQGKAFLSEQQDNWVITTCPMSSEAMAESPGGQVYAAWDTEGKIYFRPLSDPRQDSVRKMFQAPGGADDRQHPALAFNKNGDMLLAWTEGTGWNRGGALAWQLYDKNLQPKESGRRAGAIPVWGLPAVIAEADGRFTILH